MKRIIPILLLLAGTTPGAVQAQQADNDSVEVSLQIGGLIELATCKGSTYAALEMHRKSRTTLDLNKPAYDTLSGEGFFNWFFREGDFDSQKVPCDLKGKTFPIVSIESFTDRNTGAVRDVLFLKVDKFTYIWCELGPALDADEIRIVP
jgi:hypothetical protein